MRPHRKKNRATAWRMGLVVLLPACAMFGEPPGTEREFRSELPAATAAWLLAEVCRQEMPAADDLPMHAYPPIQASGPHAFSICYLADAGDGFRIRQNGRISPPDGSAAALRGCRFLPSERPTVPRATTTGAVRIEIVDEDAAGCSIRIRLAGSPAADGLADRLARALATGLIVQRATAEVDQGELIRAETRAANELERGNTNPGARLDGLTARLQYVRARVDLARQDFAAARAHLRQAVRTDATLRVARQALADTCRRMADAPGVMTYDREHLTIPVTTSAPDLLRGAADLLADRDPTAASHWARTALARAPYSRTAMRLLAAALTAQGKPQRALETELLALDEFGFDATLVLGVAKRYATLGDEVAGVLVLARFRAQLEITQPQRADRLLRRLCRSLPADRADRLLRRDRIASARAFRRAARPASLEIVSRQGARTLPQGDAREEDSRLAFHLARYRFPSTPGARPAR